MGAHRRGLRRAVRPPRADRAAPRGGRGASGCAGRSPGSPAPSRMPGTVAFVVRDARLRPLRRVQPDDAPGRTSMADIEAPYLVDQPGLGELLVTFASVGGLLAAVLLVAARVRSGAARSRARPSTRRGRSSPTSSARCSRSRFVYVVAHYVTTFLVQGQFAIPLLSDPLGRGWDLFGTARRRPRPHASSRRT